MQELPDYIFLTPKRCFYFKGILDYLDNLTVTQIRKLFAMLSTLAFTNHQDGGLIQVTEFANTDHERINLQNHHGRIIFYQQFSKYCLVTESNTWNYFTG